MPMSSSSRFPHATLSTRSKLSSHSLLPHYLILPQRPIPPVLRLKQHRATFQALQTMPLPLFDIQDRATRNHVIRLNQSPIRGVEILLKMPTDADASFAGTFVPMYRHHSPRIQRIQHPLRQIIQAISKIQVYPKSRRGLCRCRQLFQHLLVDDHICRLLPKPE